MITSTLLALTLSQTALPPGRLVNLPTGARIYIERRATPGKVRLGLFADSRGLEDRPSTQGFRHMLEHFVSRHAPAKVQRLERKGLFLEAYTTRDAMAYEIEVKTDQIDDALPALIGILQPLRPTKEEIAREAEIILHELALESSPAAAVRLVEQKIMGSSAVDFGGSAESFAELTPELLTELQRQQFSPRRLTVTATGDVNPAAMENLARTLLGSLKWANAAGAWTPPSREIAPRPASMTGSAVGLKVEGMPRQETVNLLATGLWIARLLPQARFYYDESPNAGVMAIWSANPDLRSELSALTLGEVQWAQFLARMMRDRRSDEASYAWSAWRALVFNEPLVSERARTAFNNVDLAAVQSSLEKWRTGTMLSEKDR